MISNVYVNLDTGSDSFDGSQMAVGAPPAGPKATLAGALALVDGPITATTTIHLAINTTAAYTGDCEIIGIHCIGSGVSFIIQPYGWNDGYYQDIDGDPYDDGGEWGIKEKKPLDLKLRLQMENCKHVILRGLNFISEDGSSAGLILKQNTDAQVVYSAFEGKNAMLNVNLNSFAVAENCFFLNNTLPIVCALSSDLALTGNTFIDDPIYSAIAVQYNSSILIYAWHDHAGEYYQTTITINSPRKQDFKAIVVKLGSTISIQDDSIDPTSSENGALHICNNNKFLGPKFYCIVLESKSMFAGVGNARFTTLNSKDEQATMPITQMIKGAKNENTTIIM